MHHPDDPNWPEVERACSDGSVFDADLETLRRYAHVTTRIPPSHNSAFHAKFAEYCATIRHRIEILEAAKTERRLVFWAKVAAIVAGIASVLSIGAMAISNRMISKNSRRGVGLRVKCTSNLRVKIPLHEGGNAKGVERKI